MHAGLFDSSPPLTEKKPVELMLYNRVGNYDKISQTYLRPLKVQS